MNDKEVNPPTDDDLQSAMESITSAIAAGTLEEVPDNPGFYRLTEKGRADAIAQLQTPEGLEIIRRLDEAHKAGKL